MKKRKRKKNPRPVGRPVKKLTPYQLAFTTKVCSKCKRRLNKANNFYRDKNKPDGYRYECILCYKKANPTHSGKPLYGMELGF